MKKIKDAPEDHQLVFDVIINQFFDRHCTEDMSRVSSIVLSNKDLSDVLAHFFLWGVSCAEQRNRMRE